MELIMMIIDITVIASNINQQDDNCRNINTFQENGRDVQIHIGTEPTLRPLFRSDIYTPLVV